MAYLTINNVEIKGISACVPKSIEENISSSIFDNEQDASKFIDTVGVERKRIADKTTTASDLCFNAAERLISALQWNRGDIDCLIFVTQTPDYILPATSCVLQDRLGLNKECYTLDISLGCSGWVYGMSVITNLLSSGCFNKGLLLCGDTISKIISKQDKSSYPLFGDAGSATALEYSQKCNSPMHYHLATDGSGSDAIIIPEGAYRNGVSKESFDMETVSEGITRNKLDLILNGMDVFSFGVSKAPQSVNKLLEKHDINREDVNYCIFHQANKFMNEKIRKKLKLTEMQVPYSLKNFGNTSSATIPLTLITELSNELQNEELKMIGCGFGVGLSWGTIYFSTDKICVPKLIEV